MSEISSAHSSDYVDGSNPIDDILNSPLDLTPRSTARRTTRNRVPRSTPAGISDSDFSENGVGSTPQPHWACRYSSESRGAGFLPLAMSPSSAGPMNPAPSPVLASSVGLGVVIRVLSLCCVIRDSFAP